MNGDVSPSPYNVFDILKVHLVTNQSLSTLLFALLLHTFQFNIVITFRII